MGAQASASREKTLPDKKTTAMQPTYTAHPYNLIDTGSRFLRNFTVTSRPLANKLRVETVEYLINKNYIILVFTNIKNCSC
jgi:hypothetical protein